MYYVELLRARRVLFWFVVVMLAGVALASISVWATHPTVRIDTTPQIPFSALLGLSTVIAFVIATCVAPGLSAEGATTAIAWTRPQSRTTIAWQYVAVDVGTILVAYVLQLLFTLAALALFGGLHWLYFDSLMADVLVLGLACALMWYGLVTAAAARLPRRGALVAGLSWGVFLVLGGLLGAPLPPLLHGLVVGLDLLNPVAYFSGFSFDSGAAHVQHLSNLPGTTRLILASCIAAVAIVANVRLWSTREA